MREVAYNSEPSWKDENGKPIAEEFSFGYSPTDTDVKQTAITNNTVNTIDNSQGFMSGMGKDGASTLIMGVFALAFVAIVGVGLAKKYRKKK